MLQGIDNDIEIAKTLAHNLDLPFLGATSMC